MYTLVKELLSPRNKMDLGKEDFKTAYMTNFFFQEENCSLCNTPDFDVYHLGKPTGNYWFRDIGLRDYHNKIPQVG